MKKFCTKTVRINHVGNGTNVLHLKWQILFTRLIIQEYRLGHAIKSMYNIRHSNTWHSRSFERISVSRYALSHVNYERSQRITLVCSQWFIRVSGVAAPKEERRFFAFHDWGMSVYEPTACRLYHQIQSTDIIPGTQVRPRSVFTDNYQFDVGMLQSWFFFFFFLSRTGIRLRRQRRQLQLGPSHQRGQPLRLRVATAQGQGAGHQQDSDGRRRREWWRLVLRSKAKTFCRRIQYCRV